MTVLRRSREAAVVSTMRKSEDCLGDVAARTKNPCANCQALSSDEYCGHRGAKIDERSNPYILAAESIFKFGAIKQYLAFYWRILKSPTKNTIHSFEAGHLSDGIRFLEYSSAAYLLAIGVAGYALFSKDELVKTLVQPVFLFVTWTVSCTLYYLAMRNKGGKRRTPHEFLFFSCLTLGFTLPMAILQLLGSIGSLIFLLLAVPMYIYLARTWKYFWGASEARVLWSLLWCTILGGIAGTLILVPIWLIFGSPTPQ